MNSTTESGRKGTFHLRLVDEPTIAGHVPAKGLVNRFLRAIHPKLIGTAAEFLNEDMPDADHACRVPSAAALASHQPHGQPHGPGGRTSNLPIFRAKDASPPSLARVRDLHRSTDPNALNADKHRRMRPKMSPPGLLLPRRDLRPWWCGRCGEPRSHCTVRLPHHPRSRRLGVDNIGPKGTTDLQSSDYQKPLPDSAGHDGTLRLTSSDTSRQYVLVLDVDGCFG
jgi:hypothetical protein